jgi:hypothetical protein
MLDNEVGIYLQILYTEILIAVIRMATETLIFIAFLRSVRRIDILFIMIWRRNCTWSDQVVTAIISAKYLLHWPMELTYTEEKCKTIHSLAEEFWGCVREVSPWGDDAHQMQEADNGEYKANQDLQPDHPHVRGYRL